MKGKPPCARCPLAATSDEIVTLAFPPGNRVRRVVLVCPECEARIEMDIKIGSPGWDAEASTLAELRGPNPMIPYGLVVDGVEVCGARIV